MPPARLEISIPTASFDGVFHGRYPHGDAPAGAVLAGAASDTTSAGASLTTSGGGGGFTPDFFISSTGSDSNTGLTSSVPWAITSLLSTNSNNSKMAGKKVGLMDGTYNCRSLTSSASGNDFSFPVLSIPPGPNPSTPTVVQAVNRQQAILDFTGNLSVNSMIGQNPTGTTGNITIDGFVITGGGTSTMNPIDLRYGTGSRQGVLIQNCIIGDITHSSDGSNTACILLQGITTPIVNNCTLQNINKVGTQPDHAHGITIFTGGGGGTVKNCTFNGCFNGVDGKTGAANWTVAYCYFTNMANKIAIHGMDGAQSNPNGGAGSNTAGTNTNVFHHNVLDDCGLFREGDVNQTGSTQNITAYNNTIFLGSASGSGGGDMRALNVAGDNPKAIYYNNILVRTTGTGAMQFTPNMGVVDYNCYAMLSLSNFNTLSGSGSSSLAAWQSASGVDAHSISSTSPTFPQFVSTITPGNGPGQYQLGGSSPVSASGANPGRVGGVIGGSLQDMGAWGFDPALGASPSQIGAV